MKAHVPSWPNGTQDMIIELGPKEALALEEGLDEVILANPGAWMAAEPAAALEALRQALKEAKR